MQFFIFKLIVLNLRFADASHFAHSRRLSFKLGKVQQLPKQHWNKGLLILIQIKIKNRVTAITQISFPETGSSIVSFSSLICYKKLCRQSAFPPNASPLKSVIPRAAQRFLSVARFSLKICHPAFRSASASSVSGRRFSPNAPPTRSFAAARRLENRTAGSSGWRC